MAIQIVYYHTARMFGPSRFAYQSPIAVDFLFLLSGFVMTHAYEQKLDLGWSTRELLRTRLLRLYPIYLLGLISGFAFFVLQMHFGKANTSLLILMSIFSFGLLLLPVPALSIFHSAPQGLYPFDVPAWSLPNQLLANVVHGVLLRRRSTLFLVIFAATVSAFLLRMVLLNSTLGLGAERPYYVHGFLRVLFAYPTGMLIHRLWRSGRCQVRVSPLLLCGLVVACLYIPTFSQRPGLWEWGVVIFIYPLLLLLGANSPLPGRRGRLGEWLGSISYPLYMLHVAFFAFFEQAWTHLTKHRMERDAPWAAITCLLLLMGSSHWFAKYYDPAARRWMSARFQREASGRKTATRPPIASGVAPGAPASRALR